MQIINDDKYFIFESHIDKNRIVIPIKNIKNIFLIDKLIKKISFIQNNFIIIKLNYPISTNEIIKKYNTFIDASKDINPLKNNAGAISCCCKGYRKTALGYKWIFLDE